MNPELPRLRGDVIPRLTANLRRLTELEDEVRACQARRLDALPRYYRPFPRPRRLAGPNWYRVGAVAVAALAVFWLLIRAAE